MLFLYFAILITFSLTTETILLKTRLQVVSSSPSITVQETEAHRGFPSFSKYTVHAADPQAAISASISISSATSEQTLIIPVTLIHVADYSGTGASQGQCASFPCESQRFS